MPFFSDELVAINMLANPCNIARNLYCLKLLFAGLRRFQNRIHSLLRTLSTTALIGLYDNILYYIIVFLIDLEP